MTLARRALPPGRSSTSAGTRLPRALPHLTAERGELERRDERLREECVECVEAAEGAEDLDDGLERGVHPRLGADDGGSTQPRLARDVVVREILLEAVGAEPGSELAEDLGGGVGGANLGHRGHPSGVTD